MLCNAQQVGKPDKPQTKCFDAGKMGESPVQCNCHSDRLTEHNPRYNVLTKSE